ncbi:metallo-beta-lactamase superfamily [Pyrenophora seminiperda CCB06]|uniref:Metallo-beta-lactamase superfamily n=1 Tax=Pyrenophora seminiperda CCB06 TaxID=1302712 RepID=A0A3M7LZV2_9PLEO|nr:metallo-beta-lactamase superfamily [Pyrenophora seminiperda CCB06]
MPSALAKLNEGVWGDYLEAQQGRLQALPNIEQLTPRVIRIMGGNAGLMRLQGTNTYLVGTGKHRLLIDTGQGFKQWIDSLISVLNDLGVEISHVLLTHWHSDHTGGVPDLIAQRPDYAGRIYKHGPDRFQHPIKHGQVFAVDGATVQAVFTPGHAHDHMCFFFKEENALFTGDNVLGQGQSVFEDLGLFTQSLADMAALQCGIGYPGHGHVIADLPRKMEECVRQKEARERQIRMTLESNKARVGNKGSLSLPDLVREMYGSLPPDVSELVIQPSVLATLHKMAEDRKVGFELGQGTQLWFVRDRKRPQRGHMGVRDVRGLHSKAN